MADNVAITAGSGTTISTEEITTLNGGAVSAQHLQRIATALRTADGTAIDLPGDATNGLDVDVTRLPALPAGTNNIGDVDVLSLPALPSGTNNIGDVDVVTLPSAGYSSSATFTPGASSHVAGDTNGAAAEFTSMGPSGGAIIIVSATLQVDNSSAEATAWRVHLYNVTPSSAIADSGVWDLPSGDRGQYLGFIDLPTTATDLGSTQWVEVNGLNKMVRLSGTSLFGYLVNLTTVTPGAVAHKVTLLAVAA